MPANLDRRQFLGLSATMAAGAGVIGLAGPASAQDIRDHDWPPDPALNLPPVPGMLGDRRANEMWYQLDQKTLYDPVPGIVPAYLNINSYAAAKGGVDVGPLVAWLETYRAPGYPETFRDWSIPIQEPLAVISNVLISNFDEFYARNSPNLTRAFAYFAEGVLYDPRRIATGDPVHTMEDDPPIPYPIWYAYARAMMLTGSSPSRWREIVKLIGFACALQMIAKPDQTKVNPPQPPSVVRATATAMLPLGIRELDAYFAAFPYPPNLPLSAPMKSRLSV